jgi:hypothetical protein
MNEPTFEEAQKCYSEIKDELLYMNNIRDNVILLLLKTNINILFYRSILHQVERDISICQRTLSLIKERHSEVL